MLPWFLAGRCYPERWIPCVAGPDSVHIRQAINPILFSGQTDTLQYSCIVDDADKWSGPILYKLLRLVDLLLRRPKVVALGYITFRGPDDC